MHDDVSEELIGGLYLLVVLEVEYFLEERDLDRAIGEQRSVGFGLADVGSGKCQGEIGGLVADYCLPHGLL
jgi:hypothetical protein